MLMWRQPPRLSGTTHVGTGVFARPAWAKPGRNAQLQARPRKTPNPQRSTSQILFPSAHFGATLLPQRGLAMFRARYVVALFIFFTLAAICSAQQSTATCNLDDGRQVYIRYHPINGKAEKPPFGKPWTPGGAPMTLFTEAPLDFAGSAIPLGAYSVYPIPAKEKWTLVVNKNVTPGAPYDEKQDIARATIETDQISQPADALEVAFAHVGLRCTLRIYYGKTATFADFTAKPQ